MTEPDSEVIDVYLEMRRRGVGERAAARALGASHRDIAAYATANPDFALALEDALAERTELVEHRVWEAGQLGDLTAAKQILESHSPTEWTKPAPEMVLRLQRDEPYSLEQVSALKEKLEAAQRKSQAIETTVYDGDD